LQILLVHVLIGYIVYLYRPAAQLLLPGTLIFLLFFVIIRDNKNNEALMAAAYIAGAEVFYRMTGAMVFYETGKYTVILFLLIGMFYKGTSSKTVPYWIYLLILIPGIVMASITLDYDVVFRKAIAFNLSGPVCLGVSALYCYYKKVSTAQFNHILMMLLMPLVATMAYLFFYTPSIGETLMGGTNANYAASGGFGPNQVSTVMGLGAFILVTRLFVIKDKLINMVDLVLLAMMSFRGMVTFSRGGMITGLVSVLAFLIIYYQKQQGRAQSKMFFRMGILVIAGFSIWIFTSLSTQGLLNNRYMNQDAAGELKDDITTGREELIETELDAFYDYPITGVGVGKAKAYRFDETGIVSASHNEISRLLSEHGLLGLFALLILIFVPIIFWTKFKNNYYFLAFMAFWFLTINHSAMRIALPGFVYGLALLYIVDEKKDPVHRKRLNN